MSFLAPAFLVAGLVAACGPVLIHLLNRRRYRTVPWAAMDFLREAIQRRRRSLRLRDVLLLALRTLALLALGAALARPYLAGTAAADPHRAVHAVVLLDNSLSMGYEQLDGTLLGAAQSQAVRWIEQLPAGSQVSVIPLCGAAGAAGRAAHAARDDAADAVRAVTLVDRSASVAAAVDLAVEAAQRLPELPHKRVLLVGDRQLLAGVEPATPLLARLPAPLEQIEVGPADPENAWVADLAMQDTLADAQSPVVFSATVRYQGSQSRRQVEVRLSVAGRVVSTTSVDLLPEQSREVRFPPYQFEGPSEPGQPAFVPVEVSLAPDRLAHDDRRLLVVPVVASLPVVFVDQYGSGESPAQNRFGETLPLRRLLSAEPPAGQAARGLVRAAHVTIDQLDRAMLQDARLVVIAGVRAPGGAAELLRQYVVQGGQLVIAAGGEFDAAAWSSAAWRDGAGILPLPLKPGQVGHAPDEARQSLRPFQLDVHSLIDEVFSLEQVSREELHDLYTLPFFFRAVAADTSVAAARGRGGSAASDRQSALRQINARLAQLTDLERQGRAGPTHHQERATLEAQLAVLQPSWLRWSSPQAARETAADGGDGPPGDEVRVLASFSNGLPYLVRRRIGQGEVLLVTSGFSPSWNTLPLTNTMLVFDRLVRRMLDQTLPRRQLTTSQQHFEPVAANERNNLLVLTGPRGYDESLPVDAAGPHGSAVAVGPLPMRGIYHLASRRVQESGGPTAEKLWEVPLAANGPAEESQLRPTASPAALTSAGPGQTAAGNALHQASVGGQTLWKVCLVWLLVCLLGELVVLGWPALRGAAETPETTPFPASPGRQSTPGGAWGGKGAP